jgi:hypothetical protein
MHIFFAVQQCMYTLRQVSTSSEQQQQRHAEDIAMIFSCMCAYIQHAQQHIPQLHQSVRTSVHAAEYKVWGPTWYQEAIPMLRRTVMAAPMRLGWHHVLTVSCTLSKTVLMKSRVGSTATASAAPSAPPL